MKKVEENTSYTTKFREEVFPTRDLNAMRGMFLAERLLRTWNEDFADEDTGDVVSIERNELIFERGTFLSNDVISKINFFLESGDIKEVLVSNQQRYGMLGKGNVSVWSVTAKVNSKKQSYLLYANSMEMASKIITDYLEQDVSGLFVLHTIKEMDYSTLIPVEEDTDDEDFYNIELEVLYEGGAPFDASYILKAHDAESAKKTIVDFITQRAAIENRKDPFEVTIISAKKISCYGIVDYKFSQEYFDSEK